MLSVAEARAKARKRLTSSMAEWAAEAVAEVRVEIALHPPTEKQVLTDQAAAADWAASWRAVEAGAASARAAEANAVTTTAAEANASETQSVGIPTSGLEIDWEERNWARVGRQRVPIRLRLTTPDVVAAFAGGDTARDWRRLRDRAAAIRQRFGEVGGRRAGDADRDDYAGRDVDASRDGDGELVGEALAAAVRSQAKRILGLSDASFATVIAVVDWLRTHRLGSLRPRQLPIRGVDSKWFESHRSLVIALLAGIGHADAVSVLDAEPRLRLRILDPALVSGAGSGEAAADSDTTAAPAPTGVLDDITAPISQLSGLPLAPKLVFVFENLESVLAMPAWPSAVAVHGSGYAVDQVTRLDWIAVARVLYWGDLDSHGFAILNRLRSRLPGVESVLMDEASLLAHADLWVPEPKPHTGTFAQLTGSEARTLDRLRTEGDVRLEQERIPWETALGRLRTAAGDATEGHLGEEERDRGERDDGSTDTQGHLGEGSDDHR